jgi:hypothetical protein
LGYKWAYFGTLYGTWTVNSEGYSATLKDKLKPDIRSKRTGLLSKTVLRHYGPAGATIENIQKLNLELLRHAPYSPDLAPSDYRLLGSLKKALRGRRFGSDEEVKQLGFATNQKYFSLMELRSLLNVIKSVWISREIMLKNDVIIMYHLYFSNKK